MNDRIVSREGLKEWDHVSAKSHCSFSEAKCVATLESSDMDGEYCQVAVTKDEGPFTLGQSSVFCVWVTATVQQNENSHNGGREADAQVKQLSISIGLLTAGC